MTNANLQMLIADVVAGNQSLIELMRSAPAGDYRSHVEVRRLALVMMQEPQVLRALVEEARRLLQEAGHDPDEPVIEKELARKDGERRFSKLVEYKQGAARTGESLLNGSDFEACLTQYLELLTYVESLWVDACDMYKNKKFPLAAFTSILVMEEVGKLSRLSDDLVSFDVPEAAVRSGVDRDHRRKHFIGVMSGALINSRLDRVLGKEVVRKLLHDAESNELEKIRQSCLYIECKNGVTLTPRQQIDETRARTLVVLAGEVMTEVLGFFPWEFERMIEKVVEFEREIGMPEANIARL